MTQDERLRRVALICCHFARNLAYYRAGWQNKRLILKTEFWRGVNGNCIDIAILESCKLFADKKDKHYWENIISDKASFEVTLLQAIGPGAGKHEFEQYVKKVRTYRDKFVAHLDNDLTFHIPGMDDSLAAVRVYHRHIVEHEATGSKLLGLPDDLGGYYDACFKAARLEYQRYEV